MAMADIDIDGVEGTEEGVVVKELSEVFPFTAEVRLASQGGCSDRRHQRHIFPYTERRWRPDVPQTSLQAHRVTQLRMRKDH